MPEVIIPPADLVDGRIALLDLVLACGFAKSRGDGRRIIAERGIRLNGTILEDSASSIAVASGDVLQRGKRRFAKLLVR